MDSDGIGRHVLPGNPVVGGGGQFPMRGTELPPGKDLERYAAQRARLAGSSLLANGHTYLAPLDELRERFDAEGRRFVSFANYDYLGLADDPRVKQAACEAIMSIGVGASASRLVGGERRIHGEMERDMARFLGVEDTLAMVSGYMANLSLVGHLMTKRDLILVDELSHNSIMVGTEISRAEIVEFAHNSLAALDRILAERRHEFERVLVIVEGLYSMDGDIPHLPGLLELRQKHHFWLAIDEAHSIGVLGPTGAGLTEYFGVDPNEIDFIIGTLSKSFVSAGGFIAGRKVVLDWLRYTLPGFVYSVGLPPMIAATVRTCLDIIHDEPWRLKKLHENSQHFVATARRHGLDVGDAAGAGVVPVLFDDLQHCMQVSYMLLEAGYYAPPIVQVGVPRDKPRIRCFISAAHTSDQIEGMLACLAEIARLNVDSGLYDRVRAG